MATVEDHGDNLLIIGTNREEQAAIDNAMAALGTRREEVGDGVVLFLLEGGVIFRTRQEIAN
jgi:hypothetical protein